MESNFITYKQALALKELGFDEPCFAYFKDEEFQYPNLYEPFKNSEQKSWFVTAPLKQQVFKWFRDEQNIVHTVYSNASGYIWELHYNKERGGTHICDSEESGDCELSGMFTTYEKAESSCIDKLIELIKEKK
jgi:hypothetical protein